MPLLRLSAKWLYISCKSSTLTATVAPDAQSPFLVAETLALTVLSVASGVSVRRVTTSPEVKPHSVPSDATAVTAVSTTNVRFAGSSAAGGVVEAVAVAVEVEADRRRCVAPAAACACCAANCAFTSSAIACLTSGDSVTGADAAGAAEAEESALAPESSVSAGSPAAGGSCAAAYAACRFAAIR